MTAIAGTQRRSDPYPIHLALALSATLLGFSVFFKKCFVSLISIKTRCQLSLTLLVFVAGNNQLLHFENYYLVVPRHILPDVIGYKFLLVLVNAEPLVNGSEHQTRPS